MAVVLATVAGRCMRALGLTDTGTAFGSISATATQYNVTDINDAVLAADKLVYTAGLLTPNHFWRKLATTPTAVTSGALLATHLGDVDSVTFVITGGARAGTHGAILSPLAQIIQDNLNPSALSLLLPRYAIFDNRIYHNAAGLELGGASSITVNADIVAFTQSGACVSPDEAEDSVYHGAMRSLQTLDGMGADAAGRWDALFVKDIGLLAISPQALAQAQGQMGMAA